MPRLLPSVSILTLIAATPAVAQVSAADLWAEWQATAAATDQEMTADVTETGDGLILENFRTETRVDGTTTVSSLDRITLTELADGSVSVDLSQPYRASIMFPEQIGGPMVTIEILLMHQGLDISVSGAANERTYRYLADSITLTEGEIRNDSGEPIPVVDMEIVARDMDTTYVLTGSPGVDQRFESTGSVGSIAARFDILPPPPESGQLKASFAMGALTSEAAGTVIALTGVQQTGSGLPDGFDISGNSAYDFSRFEMSFEDAEQNFSIYYANYGGTLGVALSNDRLSYDIAAESMETRVSGSDLPVPVDVSAASSELRLLVPLAAADTPSGAAVRLSYRNLAVSEDVWAMADPAGALPRNPLTVVLDATAQVQILADLLSEETMAMDQPPGELRALSVSELEISFGDTSLTGTADMTFAPGQAVPQPVGQADLSLVGGNALLDQLQSAGVINAEQAGMARGVAGMFSRPGALPDTLETTIEFLEGGSITANGVPLQ